jgi:NitT/TauT family transport system ATP-binding protein
VTARPGHAIRPAPAGPAGVGRARPTSIAVEGLAKVFRRGDVETHALEGIDLQVGIGEFLAVVGPSGCGKSTLLRLIAGLIAPSDGRVTIDGRTVSAPETQLGIVFQKPILLEWRTVLGNVLLQAEMRRLDAGAYLERARRLLLAVGLEGFEDRYPHELSGGMQQRAAIVRALIHDPPLLLMDEPFGALDALTREQMRIDLEELWLSTQKTVVFITHSIDEAVLLADRVLVMSPRPGRIERVIDVDLPRPRGLEARALAQFDAAVAAITEIFLARGVLHSGTRGPKLLQPEET